MNNKPPKGMGIRERVKWMMERDQTCIRDAENFRAKWGEYPQGMSRKKIKSPSVKSVSHPDRVMLAKSEFFEGRAVWYYEVGAWACRSADDCLKFLLKKSVADAQLELTRRGFTWEWVKR